MASIVIDPDYGVDAPEITTPATPVGGRRRLYAKADGWYDKDDAGAETKLVSGGAETITALHTFDRDPSAPFAVTASSAKVDNLDADKLDGNEASAFATAGHNHGTDGVVTKHSTVDVSNPPTDAELDSAFGTPAAVGAGFLAGIDDNGGGVNVYLVYSTGAVWVVFTGTIAS